MTDNCCDGDQLGFKRAQPYPDVDEASDPARQSSTSPVDRRRPGQNGQSPITTFHQMPSAVVLDRLPVPIAAVDDGDAIIFANKAFDAMLGYRAAQLSSLQLQELVHHVHARDCTAAVLPPHSDRLIDLFHRDGWIVRAAVSASIMLRHDDPVALVTFYDLTNTLWALGSPRT